MIYRLLLIPHFVLLVTAAEGQNGSIPETIHSAESEIEAESIKSDQAQEDYQHFDAAEQYARTPLLLNTASHEELEAFPFFDEIQINALLEHKKHYGDIVAIEELQVIPGFDEELIRAIKPFVSVGKLAGQKTITARRLVMEGDNTLMVRFQKNLEPADEDSAYPGSKEKIYLRYKYQLGDRIRFGITAEKDPGEYFFQNSRSAGFDFYSGHLIIKSKSFIRQLTLGDYAIQHGQGLVMWSGMGFGKSSEVLNIQKNPGGIRPYTSVDENNFFRGACLTAQANKWRLDIFFSSHRKDGNLTMLDGTESITSLQTSGYHRTDAELEDKSSVNETTGGVLINKSQGAFTIGGILYFTHFSKTLSKETDLYNQFEFQGTDNANYGIHIKYLYKNISTFGEVARSKNGSMAYLFGSIIHLHPKLSYAVLVRDYEKDYQALHAAGFAENTKTANEAGLFSGVQLKLPKSLSLSIYLDCFQFPWLKYMVDAPSSGHEFLAQLKWKPRRTFESYLLFKTKSNEKNTSSQVENLHSIESHRKSSLRWNLRIKLNETWEWGSRVEHSMFKKGDQKNRSGFLMFQDILFHPLKSPLALGLRYAIFDTDDYDTRIYAYENDVLFSYSIPAVQGRGERLYINLHFRPGRMVELWLRYSVTSFWKELSATEQEEGNADPKKEIKAQIRFRF